MDPTTRASQGPAVILQDDAFDAAASITICPFGTHVVDAPLLRLPIEPSAQNGLRIVGIVKRVGRWRTVGCVATPPKQDVLIQRTHPDDAQAVAPLQRQAHEVHAVSGLGAVRTVAALLLFAGAAPSMAAAAQDSDTRPASQVTEAAPAASVMTKDAAGHITIRAVRLADGPQLDGRLDERSSSRSTDCCASGVPCLAGARPAGQGACTVQRPLARH